MATPSQRTPARRTDRAVGGIAHSSQAVPRTPARTERGEPTGSTASPFMLHGSANVVTDVTPGANVPCRTLHMPTRTANVDRAGRPPTSGTPLRGILKNTAQSTAQDTATSAGAPRSLSRPHADTPGAAATHTSAQPVMYSTSNDGHARDAYGSDAEGGTPARRAVGASPAAGRPVAMAHTHTHTRGRYGIAAIVAAQMPSGSRSDDRARPGAMRGLDASGYAGVFGDASSTSLSTSTHTHTYTDASTTGTFPEARMLSPVRDAHSDSRLRPDVRLRGGHTPVQDSSVRSPVHSGRQRFRAAVSAVMAASPVPGQHTARRLMHRSVVRSAGQRRAPRPGYSTLDSTTSMAATNGTVAETSDFEDEPPAADADIPWEGARGETDDEVHEDALDACAVDEQPAQPPAVPVHDTYPVPSTQSSPVTATYDMYDDFTTASANVSPCGGNVVYGVHAAEVAAHDRMPVAQQRHRTPSPPVTSAAALSHHRSQRRLMESNADMDTPEPPTAELASPLHGSPTRTPQRTRGGGSARKEPVASGAMLSPAARAAARALLDSENHVAPSMSSPIGMPAPASGLRHRHRRADAGTPGVPFDGVAAMDAYDRSPARSPVRVERDARGYAHGTPPRVPAPGMSSPVFRDVTSSASNAPLVQSTTNDAKGKHRHESPVKSAARGGPPASAAKSSRKLVSPDRKDVRAPAQPNFDALIQATGLAPHTAGGRSSEGRPSMASHAAAVSVATNADSAAAVSSHTADALVSDAVPPLAHVSDDHAVPPPVYRPSNALNEDEYDFAIVVRAFAGGKRQAAALARAKAQADAIAAAHAQQARLFGGGRADDDETVAPQHVHLTQGVTTRPTGAPPAREHIDGRSWLRKDYGSSSLEDALSGTGAQGVTAVKEAHRARRHRQDKRGGDQGKPRSRKHRNKHRVRPRKDSVSSDSASLSDSDEMSNSSDDELPEFSLEIARRRREQQEDDTITSVSDLSDDDRGMDDLESITGYYSSEPSSRRSSMMASVVQAAARTWRAARRSILGPAGDAATGAVDSTTDRRIGERRVTWSKLPTVVDLQAAPATEAGHDQAPRARALAPGPSQRTIDSDTCAITLPPGAIKIGASTTKAVTDADAAAAAYEEALVSGRVHKCAEVLAALRAAGLRAKRIRSLSRRVWLIKVSAPEWRLEMEAERLRLRMRRRDGGWSRFKCAMRAAFLPAIADEEESHRQGAPRHRSKSDDDRLSDSGLVGVKDDVEGRSATGSRARLSSLFHSSDRQTLIDHILRCSSREGGADLGENSPLGAFVEHMFPLHMYARLEELRSDWLATWRPQRSRPEHDRIGFVLDEWYAEPKLVDLTVALSSDAKAPVMPAASTARTPKRSGCCGSRAFAAGAPLPPTSSGVGDIPRYVLSVANYTAISTCVCCCKCRRSASRLCCGILSQPLDRIAAYFGETVAFYFAWLQFYTTWLILPSIAGVLLFFGQIVSGTLDIAYVPLFSLFMALWSILFLEFWQRRNAHLAQRWGVLNYEDEEVVRPQFQGWWKQDVSSGVVLRVYPAWRRVLKFAVTIPIILGFIAAVLMFMVLVFSTRDRLLAQMESYDVAMDARNAVLAAFNGSAPANVTIPPMPVLQLDVGRSITDAWNGGLGGFFSGTATVAVSAATTTATTASATSDMASQLSLASVRARLMRLELFFSTQHDWRWWLAMTVPPIVYGCMMPLFDWLFNKLALFFNDWENHVTESQYRNHRIAKVFFYRFLSCFVSLFYYAFSPSHSLQALFVQLAAFLVVGQLFNNILELCSGSLLRCWRELRFSRRVRHAEDSGLGEGRRGDRLLRHAQSKAWAEARLPLYDTFHDYAELLIQYGYVTFFSWAFPLAPLCALINNVIEMRTDAFRLCHLTQRPIAHKAGGIGVWYNVLLTMSMLAVLTNCAHLALSSRQFQVYFPNLTDAQRLLVIFVFEHIVLSLRVMIGYIIPAVPASVKRRAQRDAFALARLQGRKSVGSVAS